MVELGFYSDVTDKKIDVFNHGKNIDVLPISLLITFRFPMS